MISPLLLERPGRWRSAAVASLLLLPLLPMLPLATEVLARAASGPGPAFWAGLRTAAALALGVALLSWLVGLPLGVAAALYELPARRLLLALVGLPLLLPSLLPALGWSALAARLGPRFAAVASSPFGGLLVFAGSGIPLVLLTAYAASLQLSQAQLDAARLAGGERTVMTQAARSSAPPALLAAALAAVPPLTDPAPGLVLGYPSAAAEVLTRFSALFDFPGAAQQGAILGLAVLGVALPLALPASTRLASPALARPTGQRHRRRLPLPEGLAAATFVATLVPALALPLLGLLLPAMAAGPELEYATRTVLRTGPDTLLYGLGAGLIATALGGGLALACGRSPTLRRAALGACLVLFALPACLPALGVVQGATGAPAWVDPVLRSRFTVAAALGLRALPVAAVLMFRAWGSLPVSWAGAAAVHGVPLGRYLWAVLWPALAPSAACSVLLAALLATADVGTVLMLHPPGRPSLPLAVFTVMANAPEARIATLCLLYVGIAAATLALALSLARKRAP